MTSEMSEATPYCWEDEEMRVAAGMALLLVGLGMGNLQLVAGAQTPALPALTKMPPSVPYRWKSVVIRAGGFVSGIEFSPAMADLVYARTDVGGAYRSDDGGEHWIALTDRFNQEDTTYLGIESIAPDPSDANKVYIAEGMYTASWGGPAAIFRSSDKGRTFEKTPLPFKMGGNDDGRGVGERLAVDPNDGTVLYFGSRLAGLWRSTDAAKTWSHVDSFPIAQTVAGPGERAGLTFVAFDKSDGAKGAPTKTIYVGAAQAGASLYRSTDAGATWQLVPGAPKDMFPSHAEVVPGVKLYLSYVDNIGPNGISNGGIFEFIPKDGKWKDISPVHPGVGETRKFGFGGLAMDAEHPDTVMVTTLDEWYPADQIYRTVNGGKSWKEVGPTATYSCPAVPWVYWHKDKCNGTGWMNGISIDPFHPGKVMYTTGEGIFGSADVTNLDTGKPTHWGFPNEGLEELVVNALASPDQGAPLISVVSDLGGYRHESLDASPKDGFFTNPQLNTTTGLDFAQSNPMLLVRVGYGDNKSPRGGYSTDNGMSWKPFAFEPPSSKDGAGKVAISADGKSVIWSPDKGAPMLTSNWGKTWTACEGLTDKMHAVADRVNPLKFYSFNQETGQLLESIDGGHVFAVRTKPVAPRGDHAVIAATPGVEGDIWISAGDKVYHSTDSGISFAALEGLHKVNNIGFGKAAAGRHSPTIYLNGKVGESEGILRSDDAGQSWVRMDDPDHQFGWKNAVIGDARVFGRVYLATGGRGIIYGDPVAAGTATAGR
jgi:photosystem II stability/assembly factor-like uncharacterized protein